MAAAAIMVALERLGRTEVREEVTLTPNKTLLTVVSP